MQETWIISDTHFYHSNVIRYENRPFKDTIEMNQTIIDNWNKVVKPEHLIIHLGDIAFANKDKVKEIMSQLNGEKILIKGNHDTWSNSFYHEIGFSEVSKYPIIFRDFYMMSHYPLYMNINMPYVNIHGHTHSNCGNRDSSKYFNASIERTSYAPINFKKIEKYFKALEDAEFDIDDWSGK